MGRDRREYAFSYTAVEFLEPIEGIELGKTYGIADFYVDHEESTIKLELDRVFVCELYGQMNSILIKLPKKEIKVRISKYFLDSTVIHS